MKKLAILMILVLAASTSAWSDTPDTSRAVPATPAAPNYNLDWYSINSGGTVDAASTNYQMGASVGQAVAGAAAGTNYNLGMGFWYLFGGAAPEDCLVEQTGDVDTSGAITAADIIACVNYVFKGGAVPLPCEAAGDANCDAAVTASDIIYLVNHVFKGGAAPCDVCTMIPGIWTCP